jgi:hypothetical protein
MKQMDRQIGVGVAVVAMLIVAVLLVSVKPEAPLIDQKLTQSDSEYLEQIFSAPIVVVGSILSDTLVRGPVPSVWTRSPLQLRKLKLTIENVLRGGATPGTATVYYFTWAGAYNGPRPLGLWAMPAHSTPIQRRIFWLKRDGGVLRTACDGWDYCTMPANSGSHPEYKTDPDKPLGYALADIFFTRGHDVTDDEFAAQVEWGAPSTVPEPYLFEKLRHLAATDAPIVKAAACRQLSYYNQTCGGPQFRPEMRDRR